MDTRIIKGDRVESYDKVGTVTKATASWIDVLFDGTDVSIRIYFPAFIRKINAE